MGLCPSGYLKFGFESVRLAPFTSRRSHNWFYAHCGRVLLGLGYPDFPGRPLFSADPLKGGSKLGFGAWVLLCVSGWGVSSGWVLAVAVGVGSLWGLGHACG